MRKNYDPRLIMSYRSYKISDLCRIYKAKKLHPQTLRKWINSGELKAIIDGKTILIYGAVLKKFLVENNSKGKRSLKITEFKCWKCKTIAPPLNNEITNLEEVKGYIKAYAICNSCGNKIQRPYKLKLLAEILKTFEVKQGDAPLLYDSSNSTSNTHINDGAKIATCEPETIKTQISTNTTSNTHIIAKTQNSNQLNLWDLI
jgi:hypothetical protein